MLLPHDNLPAPISSWGMLELLSQQALCEIKLCISECGADLRVEREADKAAHQENSLCRILPGLIALPEADDPCEALLLHDEATPIGFGPREDKLLPALSTSQ